MRKLIFHDLGVYFKLFQNQAKNVADLFSIKWEFDKMGDLSVFLGHKKLKWDPISLGTDCTSKIRVTVFYWIHLNPTGMGSNS